MIMLTRLKTLQQALFHPVLIAVLMMLLLEVRCLMTKQTFPTHLSMLNTKMKELTVKEVRMKTHRTHLEKKVTLIWQDKMTLNLKHPRLSISLITINYKNLRASLQAPEVVKAVKELDKRPNNIVSNKSAHLQVQLALKLL